MAEEGRQQREASCDVLARSIPAEQRLHGEAVPEGMQAWTAPSPADQAGLVGQSGEHDSHCVVGEPVPTVDTKNVAAVPAGHRASRQRA